MFPAAQAPARACKPRPILPAETPPAKSGYRARRFCDAAVQTVQSRPSRYRRRLLSGSALRRIQKWLQGLRNIGACLHSQCVVHYGSRDVAMCDAGPHLCSKAHLVLLVPTRPSSRHILTSRNPSTAADIHTSRLKVYQWRCIQEPSSPWRAQVLSPCSHPKISARARSCETNICASQVLDSAPSCTSCPDRRCVDCMRTNPMYSSGARAFQAARVFPF